jgi:opacity protein-like surface antigen
MLVRKLLVAAAVCAVTIAATPNTASADWLFTPYIGGNFGGSNLPDDVGDFEDESERRMNFGASLGWMGNGIAGFELDFGWAPNFFDNTAASFEFGDNNLTTFMANVLVGAPVGGQTGPGFRPYGSAGLGLMKSRLSSDFFEENDIDSNDFGFNLGAGVHGFFNDNVGLRGDVRYMRSLQDNPVDNVGVDISDDSLDLWRATVGLTFRFGRD